MTRGNFFDALTTSNFIVANFQIIASFSLRYNFVLKLVYLFIFSSLAGRRGEIAADAVLKNFPDGGYLDPVQTFSFLTVFASFCIHM